MKLRNSILFVFLALASCRSPVSLFNHIPKDYYTRHHTRELITKKREPVLCLKESKSVKKTSTEKSKAGKTQIYPEDLNRDFSVSRQTFSSIPRKPIWNLDQTEYFSANLSEKENEDSKKKRRASKIFGIAAAVLGIAAVFSIFSQVPALFFLLAASGIIFAVLSLILNPNKKKSQPAPESEAQITEKPEEPPLTKEEKEALQTEKMGLFSSLSAIALISMFVIAAGPYNALYFLAFTPLFAVFSLILGFSSLKKIKENSRKYKGKGFAYFGLTFGLIFTLILLILALIIATFFI